MSRDHTEPTTMDEPLGGAEPAWRDDRPATAAPPPADTDDDPERTIDRVPGPLAQPDDRVPATENPGDERTIDVDVDVLEHVRAAVRAARDGLAAPPAVPELDATAGPGAGPEPTRGADDDAPVVTDAAGRDADPSTSDPDPADAARPGTPLTASGIDPSLPPPPAGVATGVPSPGSGSLPPPSGKPGLAAAVAVELAATPTIVPEVPPTPPTSPAPPAPPADPVAVPAAPAPAAAPTVAGVRPGRWQPPPRLRPADLRSPGPLLVDRAPARRHLDWRWAALGILAAAVVGFLIAMALNGGDDPSDPAPGPTTAPGATTIVSTP